MGFAWYHSRLEIPCKDARLLCDRDEWVFHMAMEIARVAAYILGVALRKGARKAHLIET